MEVTSPTNLFLCAALEHKFGRNTIQDNNIYIHILRKHFNFVLYSTKRAQDILPEVTDLVHFLKDAEWKSEDDPDKHTVAYEILKTLMEHYLYRV